MLIQKTLKVIKYIGASCMLFIVSAVLGQKNSSEYSPLNVMTIKSAHADFPTDSGSGCVGTEDASAPCATADSSGGSGGGSGGDGPCADGVGNTP